MSLTLRGTVARTVVERYRSRFGSSDSLFALTIRWYMIGGCLGQRWSASNIISVASCRAEASLWDPIMYADVRSRFMVYEASVKRQSRYSQSARQHPLMLVCVMYVEGPQMPDRLREQLMNEDASRRLMSSISGRNRLTTLLKPASVR
jgi:hypothetical protein